MIEAHITLRGVDRETVQRAAARAYDSLRFYLPEVVGTDEIVSIDGLNFEIAIQDRA